MAYHPNKSAESTTSLAGSRQSHPPSPTRMWTPALDLASLFPRSRYIAVYRLDHPGITQGCCRRDRLSLNFTGADHYLKRDAIDNDEQPRGAGHDDGRVPRELCEVEKSGAIAELGVVGLKLKETLVHVLV